MSSNLPPGVTDGMIPGNRAEDAAWEELIEWIVNNVELSCDEIRERLSFGPCPTDVKKLVKLARAVVKDWNEQHHTFAETIHQMDSRLRRVEEDLK